MKTVEQGEYKDHRYALKEELIPAYLVGSANPVFGSEIHLWIDGQYVDDILLKLPIEHMVEQTKQYIDENWKP